jgi:hypothetical protein
MNFSFIPNSDLQNLQVIVKTDQESWADDIVLVYCLDEKCGAGKATIRHSKINIVDDLLNIPVPNKSSGIYIISLSFNLMNKNGFKEQFLRSSDQSKFQSFSSSYGTQNVEKKTGFPIWGLVLLFYILLYIIIAALLWITYIDWRMIGWPWYMIISLFS